MIDEVEVGHPTTGPVRVAFEVHDTAARTETLVANGARLVAEPTETPWRSLNSRLEAPAGLQISLFQELVPLEDRQRLEGFGTDADGRDDDQGG